MPSDLLQDLFHIGENMQASLADGEMDTFFDLVAERGTLLEILRSYRHPSDVDADWEEMAAALTDQDKMLLTAAELQRERMRDAVTRVEQVKEAQRSYLRPGARSTILNENLRV